MDYARPIKINETGYLFSLSVTYNEEIDVDGQKIIFPFSYISGQKTKEELPRFNHYDGITRKRYERIIRFKGYCISFAERLNDNLRNFLRRYYEIKGISSDGIYELDFSKLRDGLSDIIKKDEKLKIIFRNNIEKKSFTRTFKQVIEDRNIYTHGDLHLRLDNGALVIYYKEKNGELACEITEEVLQSFYNTCEWLNGFINQFWHLANTNKL